jgi:hypothetical protein
MANFLINRLYRFFDSNEPDTTDVLIQPHAWMSISLIYLNACKQAPQNRLPRRAFAVEYGLVLEYLRLAESNLKKRLAI